MISNNLFVREDFKKKRVKLVTLSLLGLKPTLPTPISDIRFSDIFFLKPRPTLPHVLVT